MKRVVIFDGNAMMHRAYHAIPPLTTREGKPINAVYGFTSILLRVLQDLRATHCIVTFDRPAPTFRKQLYKEYQSHRPKMEDELSSQFQHVHKLVETMEIPIFEKDGFEADDVIGTLAKTISNPDTEVIIITGDRDILQLVDEYIYVYMPVKGLSEGKLYKREEVREKFGVDPIQIIDYKGLTGDSSDNYPGVSGIGPKTALDLLTKYKTIEGIYEHLDETFPRVKAKLEEGVEFAKLSKQLATIITTVPLEIDLSACALHSFNTSEVRQLFEQFQFKSLIPRLSQGINEMKEASKPEIKEKKEAAEQTTLF